MPKPFPGVNPIILRWARERAGFSLPEIAALMHQSEERMQRWETGEDGPTYPQLEDLAGKYKLPIAVFFFSRPPQETPAERSFRRLPQMAADRLLPDTRFQIRKAQAWQLSLTELTGGRNPAQRIITRDLAVAPNASPRLIAEQVRSYLDIPLHSPPPLGWGTREDALNDWRALVEDVGVFVFKDTFKQKDVSGFALYDFEFPIIVINNSTATSRQIFTLFHELAHLLLRESGITGEYEFRNSALSLSTDKEEVFCNQFAANFLLPTLPVQNQIDAGLGSDEICDILSREFKVSREVVLRRLLDLKQVTIDEYRAKAEEWSEPYRGERPKPDKSGKGNYYPTLTAYLSGRYTQLAFLQYHRGMISTEELAEHLNIKASSVDKFESRIIGQLA